MIGTAAGDVDARRADARLAPGETRPAHARREDWAVSAGIFVALAAIYLITLAPDVTLWDSGEFNAAIASLGIPHPPGTPLYVVLARAWSQWLDVGPPAVAVNVLSALASAAACALLGRAVARWTDDRMGGIAAGIAAGGMLAVWQNATETEVYALSMLLGVAMVVAGDRAGRSGKAKDQLLLAYLIGLAVPLQVSALVAAPAAILLAASPARRSDDDRPFAPRPAVALTGAFLMAVGIGLVSAALFVAGVLVITASALVRRQRAADERVGASGSLAVAVLLGASALLFLLVRAPHDPGVNQGNPSTWQAFLDVVARRQYDVPGVWPRRAPLWLQVANLFQYADWQVAFALDDSVAASWRRTPFTLLFGALALVGARWHWRRDPRSARPLAVLLVSASLGVVAVLNLRAGPSSGYGVLPADALREAREREYFFALAFAVAAVWAGLGAVRLAARAWPGARWAPGAGLGVAALPVVLNWGAADRRREPDASLAPLLGEALLASSPEGAVVLMAGDNDSYAVWYQQEARQLRRDVTPITTPLLGADWYRAELARRHGLLDDESVAQWRGEEETMRRIVTRALSQGRPVATSAALARAARLGLGSRWILRGMAYERLSSDADSVSTDAARGDELDPDVSRRIAGMVATRIGEESRPPRDGTGRYIHRLLQCPSMALAARSADAAAADPFLVSICNFK